MALAYDDWVQLLGSFFFGEAHRGEEILFAVDEMSLAEASGLSEQDASASLAHAVYLVIGKSWNVNAVMRLVRRWEVGAKQTDHPALPFLALTVLAASRMGAYEGFAPHKFYVPLRRALVDDDLETDAPGSYLEFVEGLWSGLSDWSNVHHGGARGTLAIRDPGRFYGRGYAVQHALIKSYDLQQLDAFFRRIGLEPGEEVPPAQLLRALRVWTAGRTELWAVRLQRICNEEELAGYAEALLSREARRWDGRPRDSRTGRPVGRIRVGLSSMKRPEVGFFAQFDERLPHALSLRNVKSAEVELHRVNGWYEPTLQDLVNSRSALMEGVELRGDGVNFSFRSDVAFALSYDDDLGAWVSADSMSFGDRFHVLVRSEYVSEVVRFAGECSTLKSMVNEPASRFLPTGWKLVENIQLDSRPRVSPPACLSSLIPVGSSPRLRLIGGLPLTSARSVFLRGGEPALALSTLCDDERISITMESTGKTERFRVDIMGNREIPLWTLELEPDRYEVRHGESSVWLQIVDGIAEQAGQGSGSIELRGRDDRVVVGTEALGVVPEYLPLTLPAPEAVEDSLLLVGPRAGDVLRVDRPTWLTARLGFDLSWKTIDAWPDFEPVWLLMRGASGRFEASVLKPLEPISTGGSTGSVWARSIAVSSLFTGSSPEVDSLWHRYRSAAGVPE